MLKNIDNSSLEELEMEIKDFIFEKNTAIMKMKKLNIYLSLWAFQKLIFNYLLFGKYDTILTQIMLRKER